MKKTLIIIGSVLVALVVLGFILFKVTFISESEVKDIVTEHANVEMADVKKWSIDLGYEDGLWEYDVEVVFNNQEYNYEINAKTGEIILYELDR